VFKKKNIYLTYKRVELRDGRVWGGVARAESKETTPSPRGADAEKTPHRKKNNRPVCAVEESPVPETRADGKETGVIFKLMGGGGN